MKLTDNDNEKHASEASTLKIKGNNVKNFNKEEPISTPVNSFEDIKLAFVNMATMIVGSNPNVKFELSPSGIPLIVSNHPSPMNSPETKKTETDNFMPKLDNHEKTGTETPANDKQNHRQQIWETIVDKMTNNNIFSQYERGRIMISILIISR